MPWGPLAAPRRDPIPRSTGHTVRDPPWQEAGATRAEAGLVLRLASFDPPRTPTAPTPPRRRRGLRIASICPAAGASANPERRKIEISCGGAEGDGERVFLQGGQEEQEGKKEAKRKATHK